MKKLILFGLLVGAMTLSQAQAESLSYIGSPEAARDEAVEAVCEMAQIDKSAVEVGVTKIYRGDVPPVATVELNARMPTESGKPWAVRHLKYVLKQEPGKNKYGWLITRIDQPEAD